MLVLSLYVAPAEVGCAPRGVPMALVVFGGLLLLLLVRLVERPVYGLDRP